MKLIKPVTVEQQLAVLSLSAGASQASKSVSEFEKWLVAGYAAVFVLALPKFAELSALFDSRNLKAALALLAIALVLSVFVLFMGAQVAAASAVGDELRKSAPALGAMLNGRPLDLDALFAEQRRGLWWPGSWGAKWGSARVLEGDHVAPGRMLAKLSQAQVYLVMLQVLLGLAAAGVCVAGLRLT